MFRLTAIGVLALAIGTAMAAEPANNERGRCTNASLSGEFAFTARGTTLAPLGLPAPLTGAFVSSGTADFDGMGNFTLAATSSFNGIVQGPATVTGSYSVNPDCSYTSKASNGATFRAAIVDGGRELLILQTNKGVVITGTAEARNRRTSGNDDNAAAAATCTSDALAGSYGFLAEGSAGAPTIPGAPIAPLAGAGIVTLKSDGSFMMSAQRSVNGVLDPQPLPLTGTYKMGAGCTFMMTFDVGFHFEATVVNRNETVFVETDPGTALIVKAKRI